MRVIKIEIQDFRGFHGNHVIELAKVGERGKQNLLVYGENGSGKSSLLLALKYLLESSLGDIDFSLHQNIFNSSENSGYVEISLREMINTPITLYRWSTVATTTANQELREASKAKGILDYKSLLEVHFIHRDSASLNIFDLLIKTLLAGCINDIDTETPKRTFYQQWNDLLTIVPRRKNNVRQISIFEEKSRIFNEGLSAKLNELQSEISVLMSYFSYPLDISFGFNCIRFDETAKYSNTAPESSIANREVSLHVKFFNQELSRPHHFLNEAKLSAIAITIYLSSLLVAPKPRLKFLILDDIFIGLDMSNRLPLIDILKEKFRDYQIFLMTYDKEWYEILKRHFSDWKMIEFYAEKCIDYEVPVLVENEKHLDKAKFYLQNHDYKAAAIYLRTAFEAKIKWFCEKKNIAVKYREKSKDLKADDFWTPVKNAKDSSGKKYIDAALAFDVDLYRSLIMNPLSHAQITTTPAQEIQNAIDTVERLEQTLNAIVNPS